MKDMKGWATKGKMMGNMGKGVVELEGWVNIYDKNSLGVETIWMSPLKVMRGPFQQWRGGGEVGGEVVGSKEREVEETS